MVVWKLIVQHKTIVSATETFFQKGVNALSKMVLKNPVACQKAQNFV